MPLTPELHHRYRARVRLRRGEGPWALKPGVEVLDGMDVVVECAWTIQTDEFGGMYPGEFAMWSDSFSAAGLRWIASGDLELLEEVCA